MVLKRVLVGLVILNTTLGAMYYKKITTEQEVVYEPYEIEQVEATVEPLTLTTEVKEEYEPVEDEFVVYRVTAYCACEICCGEWAKNREKDENGKPIVVGAWNRPLVSGFSCASPMAFGTQVELEGIGTVEVQDRTAKWVVNKYGENIIDLYMDDHEEARQFGVKYVRGVIK